MATKELIAALLLWIALMVEKAKEVKAELRGAAKAHIADMKMSMRKMSAGIDMIGKGAAHLHTDTRGSLVAIVSGITLVISGFATLVLGNYIIYAIVTNLPSINSSAYNSTQASINTYIGIVLPLFGLMMMISGFALILSTLNVNLNPFQRQ